MPPTNGVLMDSCIIKFIDFFIHMYHNNSFLSSIVTFFSSTRQSFSRKDPCKRLLLLNVSLAICLIVTLIFSLLISLFFIHEPSRYVCVYVELLSPSRFPYHHLWFNLYLLKDYGSHEATQSETLFAQNCFIIEMKGLKLKWQCVGAIETFDCMLTEKGMRMDF